MKNTRKMGIASLLLISLFLIQLIPSLGVKVKAEPQNLIVEVEFVENNNQPQKVTFTVKPDEVTTKDSFIKDFKGLDIYKTQEKELAKQNYYVSEIKLNDGQDQPLEKYFNNGKEESVTIKATATLKSFEDLTVTIEFTGGPSEIKSLTFAMKGNQVNNESEFWDDIKEAKLDLYQSKLKEIEKNNYTITDLTLDLDNQKELKEYLDDKTKKDCQVIAKATLTANSNLEVQVKFKRDDGTETPYSFFMPGKDVTTATANDFIQLVKNYEPYSILEQTASKKTHYVSSLTLDQGQDDILAAYVKDKTKAQTVTMTATLTPLEPIKVNVTVMVDGTLKSTFDLSIPAADVTKPFETEVELKDFVGEHKDFKHNIKDIPHNYKKDYKWQYSEKALEKVNQYIKDGKKKDVEISIVLSYPKENATTTTTTTKPSTHKPSRRLTSNLNKYGYRMGSLKLDQSSNSPELPDKLDLIVESEPLRRSFASKAKVPVPQGDRLIAQYFNVSTNPSINLSKYGSTLTLNIDERASSSAITVYQRVPSRKTWNRISRSQYSYDRSSGELEIEGLDDLGEFVVWINQDAKEPRPLDPRPLQRLPLNPSVQVKPNGMLPQGVAPFKPANPQVQGSLVPQVPQVNPNAQLPVTGEKNYIGIMMGTLILACGALILRKAIK